MNYKNYEQYGLKTVFSEEDKRLLDDDLELRRDQYGMKLDCGRALLNSYMAKDFSVSRIDEHYLNNAIKMSLRLAELKKIGDASLEMTEITTSVMTHMFNEIIAKRNDLISNHEVLSQEEVVSKLSFLKENISKITEFIEVKNNEIGYSMASILSKGDHDGFRKKSTYDNFMETAKASIAGLNNDMLAFPEYKKKKDESLKKYYAAKAEYDKKSIFGKFVARFNGSKKRLDEARSDSNKLSTYLDAKLRFQGLENGLLQFDNENSYGSYLNDEDEQGRSR